MDNWGTASAYVNKPGWWSLIGTRQEAWPKLRHRL